MEASVSWRKNLYAVFVAQLLFITGFCFVNPFIPLFIEKLSSLSSQEAAFWAGIATGSYGVAGFLSAPMWGIIADRWGRKLMVLRAMLGSGVVVCLMGLSPNVPYLVTMRFFQGGLGGSIAASSALVSSLTPRDKRPFALGILVASVYMGSSVGPLLGGIVADSLGYRAPFYIAGGLLIIGGLIVHFTVDEKFERPAQGEASSLRSVWHLASSMQIFPLLIIMFALRAGETMVWPIIPLFLEELNPLGRAATSAGIALALMGVIAAISATLTGRFAEHTSLKTILVVSCIGTCLVYLPPVWATTVAQSTIYIALTGLFNGGIMTSSNSLLSLAVLPNQQGTAFGVGQSAYALGMGLGPVIGGAFGSLLGLRYVFIFAAGMYLLAGLLVIKVLPKYLARGHE